MSFGKRICFIKIINISETEFDEKSYLMSLLCQLLLFDYDHSVLMLEIMI